MTYLDSLNVAQRQAVESNDSRILVVAGAGTGKTRTLTSRVAHLVDNGVSPCKIAVMTFTNAAAYEMQERIDSLIGDQILFSDEKKYFVGTLHSFCSKLLRQYSKKRGAFFDIINAEPLMNDVAKKFKSKISAKKLLDYRQQMFIGGKAAIRCKPTDKITVISMLKDFQYNLYEQNQIDYDGIILETLQLIKESKEIATEIRNQYQHIMIDEMQDTDNLQWAIVNEICPPNLFLVGDDAQSIYGFRGANPQIMIDIASEPDYTVYKLEDNYRSTADIINAANNLISYNIQIPKTLQAKGGKHGKIDIENFETFDVQCAKIVELCRAYLDKGENLTILSSQNSILNDVHNALKQSNIESRCVSDYTDLIYNVSTVELFDWLNIQIGEGTSKNYKAISEKICTAYEQSTLEYELETNRNLTFVDVLEYNIDISQKVIKHIEKTSGHIYDIINANAEDSFYSLIVKINSAVNYGSVAPLKLAKLWTQNRAKHRRPSTIKSFVDWYNNDPDITELLDGQNINLMTVHASKGLEFDNVAIVSANEFESSSADENKNAEKRRLMYVAVTRAKNNLHIFSTKFNRFGYLNFVNPNKSFVLEMLNAKMR
jgi:DNA helicase-2/ATP-dependent DNA helicase PcrA